MLNNFCIDTVRLRIDEDECQVAEVVKNYLNKLATMRPTVEGPLSTKVLVKVQAKTAEAGSTVVTALREECPAENIVWALELQGKRNLKKAAEAGETTLLYGILSSGEIAQATPELLDKLTGLTIVVDPENFDTEQILTVASRNVRFDFTQVFAKGQYPKREVIQVWESSVNLIAQALLKAVQERVPDLTLIPAWQFFSPLIGAQKRQSENWFADQQYVEHRHTLTLNGKGEVLEAESSDPLDDTFSLKKTWKRANDALLADCAQIVPETIFERVLKDQYFELQQALEESLFVSLNSAERCE